MESNRTVGFQKEVFCFGNYVAHLCIFLIEVKLMFVFLYVLVYVGNPIVFLGSW